ncbi:Scr1 family TA system antitoxin-like transcriptional regulator [Streptomyces sp. SID1034]|uniref:Scr1 family TA system antitoxin-like transcriptional regulator n=1 Tax=Streptomyces sp. SID1034 TaxID=2690248 RepID=UPI0013683FA0|nr:Scr1 family TA system antitoxin-like transcriptional regulator [Streptomyces sp. SID1034]MYV95303.1 helix-turn-helix domain-containing protein [Streptomyces sp. SID1034]
MTSDSGEPPLTEAQLPMRIVLGAYLRALRNAAGIQLKDAAFETRTSIAAVSRWERAESPISKRNLESLLHLYQVPRKETEYLLHHLPPQKYKRGQDTTRGLAGRTRYDVWTDLSDEATARYLALLRTADTVVEHCMVIPDGLRTRAYEDAVLRPGLGIDSRDAPDPLPSWLRRLAWKQNPQRRTVLVDEGVLVRPVGGYAAMSEQLRHLAHLIRSEKGDGADLTLRVVPTDHFLVVHLFAHPAELTFDGRSVTADWGLFAHYETGSRVALRLSEGLREAAAAAYSREESLTRIEAAASAMESNSPPVHVPHALGPGHRASPGPS